MAYKYFLKIWFRAISKEETWTVEQEMHSQSYMYGKNVKKISENFCAENLEIWPAE